MSFQKISGGVSPRKGRDICSYELGNSLVKVHEEGNQLDDLNNHLGRKAGYGTTKVFKNHWFTRAGIDALTLAPFKRLLLLPSFLKGSI